MNSACKNCSHDLKLDHTLEEGSWTLHCKLCGCYGHIGALAPNGSYEFREQLADPFASILAEMQAMHDKKAKDYGGGTGTDNLRASEGFGIPAWLGAIIRLNDKITRIKSFTRNKQLANESLEDSLIDICVYGVLALQLYRENQHTAESK